MAPRSKVSDETQMSFRNKSIIGTSNKNYDNIPDLTEQIFRDIKDSDEFPKGNVPKVNNHAGSNLEKKTGDNPIINPNVDLQFVTDENLYKEIIKYLDKAFPHYFTHFLSKKLSFDKIDNVMKGSSTYIATAIDMYLKSINSNLRIATQIDLEKNLNMFKGFYVNTGLVLRNVESTNKTTAEYLFDQLMRLGFSKNFFPLVFNLRDLDLDDNLNFNLTNKSLLKSVDCLNWENGTRYSEVDNFGLPKEKDENSNRQIWTNDYALSGLYLDRSLNLGSDGDGLANSNVSGRVVLAKQNSGGSK
jgi:hypothetical protein